jgi:hypothetical protein
LRDKVFFTDDFCLFKDGGGFILDASTMDSRTLTSRRILMKTALSPRTSRCKTQSSGNYLFADMMLYVRKRTLAVQVEREKLEQVKQEEEGVKPCSCLSRFSGGTISALC